MKYDNVVVGMKVVPHSKTVPSFEGLENCCYWEHATKNNQPYLFVTGINNSNNIVTLNDYDNCSYGNYYYAEDFEPYVEGDVKMKFWEILRDWENGWRGIAIDKLGHEHDFTGTGFSNKYPYRFVAIIGEEWTIKKEKSEKETQLENLVAKLQCQLTEAQSELKEIRQK